MFIEFNCQGRCNNERKDQCYRGWRERGGQTLVLDLGRQYEVRLDEWLPGRVKLGCVGLAVNGEVSSCHGKRSRHDFGLVMSREKMRRLVGYHDIKLQTNLLESSIFSVFKSSSNIHEIMKMFFPNDTSFMYKITMCFFRSISKVKY